MNSNVALETDCIFIYISICQLKFFQTVKKENNKMKNNNHHLSTRNKFYQSFTDFLNKNLFENGYHCRIKCIYNWFRKNNTCWRGKYQCSIQNCNMLFEAEINDINSTNNLKDNPVTIVIKFNSAAYDYSKHFPSRNEITDSETNEKKNSKNETVICIITPKQWDDLKKHISDKNGKILRKKFLKPFHDFVNTILQDSGIKCCVYCVYNWFSSKKDLEPCWHGLYRCVDQQCHNEYDAIIDKIILKYDVQLIIKYNKSTFFHHNNIKLSNRCTGEERKSIALELAAKGTAIFRNENITSNKPINENVLAKIKHEFNHRHRISIDSYIDVEATKKLCHILFPKNPTCQTKTLKTLNGYIQDISQNPYGYLMLSQYQIEIWNKVSISNPIWYVDATGSVHKNIVSQKKTLFYSIICHDKNEKLLMSIADFVTTSQTTHTISKYFLAIKHILDIYSHKQFAIAPIIVSDFSWAIINSVCEIFNRCDSAKYINWTYEVLIKHKKTEFADKLNGLMITRPIICSTHLLKNVVDKCNKITSSKDLKNALIFSFSLLQECNTIEQIDFYLENIYIIFNSPFFDESVDRSIKIVKTELQNRRLNKINVNFYLTNENSERIASKQYSNESNLYISQICEDEIKKNSPFLYYYDEKFVHFNSEIESKVKNIDSKNVSINKFYSPKLFDVIGSRMYLITLWSSVMIEQFRMILNNHTLNISVSRLTNNPVESWFGHLKTNLLKHNRLSCSELTCILTSRIESKYKEYVLRKKIENQTNKKVHVLKETWNKEKKRKNTKGYFVSNISNFCDFNNIDNNQAENPIETSEFNNLFKIVDSKQNNIDDQKHKFENIVDQNTEFNNIKKIYENLKTIVNYRQIETEILTSNIIIKKLISFIRKNLIYPTFEIKKHKIDCYFENLTKLNDLDDVAYVVSVNADGNCFYNSISLLIFGDQRLFYLIKIAVLFILLEYKAFFTTVLIRNYHEVNFEKYVEQHNRDCEWADQFIILATSIFFKRPLFIFSLDESSMVPYRNKYCINNNESNPLLIAYYLKHFSPIFPKNLENLNKKLEQFSLIDNFINFKNCFNIIEYN